MKWKFGGKEFLATIRTLADMKDVLINKNLPDSDFPVYWFYRNVYMNENDEETAKKHGIQHDITIIPPGRLGMEFSKTFGHSHSLVPGTEITYPELYQVTNGQAIYLFQKELNGSLGQVIMIRASAGDIVLVPPNYSHITINPGKKVLRMANWAASVPSCYDAIKKRNGGAYYLLSDGKIVKNPNYSDAPLPIFLFAQDVRRFFGIQKSIYELASHPSQLDFLIHPQNHMEIFDMI